MKRRVEIMHRPDSEVSAGTDRQHRERQAIARGTVRAVPPLPAWRSLCAGSSVRQDCSASGRRVRVWQPWGAVQPRLERSAQGRASVARKRGFFAELHHQSQLADKRKRQAATATARANAVATRQAEQARRQAERWQAQISRASAAEQREAEREAQRLHDEAMQAEAAAKNAELAQTRDEIESLLESALGTDSFVALEGLRTVAQHPPFDRPNLEVPVPQPPHLTAADEPVYLEPPMPTGLGGIFGGKKKHAEAVVASQAEFARQHAEWEAEIAALPMAQLKQLQDHQRAEQQRLEALEKARKQYRAECDGREAAAAPANDALDRLIQGLEAGAPEAVHEYVGIVLDNSEYPESFPVDHDFTYEAAANELSVRVTVPPPGELPMEQSFKYLKSKDEIVSTPFAHREQKERYADAVFKVALRTLHEVFQADRAGHVHTVALSVETEALDAATGLMKRTVLAAVAADRTSFSTFDLAKVVPLATLQHLNGVVSKSPFDLVAADTSRGVRGR
jgi:restriction system protein